MAILSPTNTTALSTPKLTPNSTLIRKISNEDNIANDIRREDNFYFDTDIVPNEKEEEDDLYIKYKRFII